MVLATSVFSFAHGGFKRLFLEGRSVENIVGKEENSGYQNFLLFSQCFLQATYSGASKADILL